MLNFYTGVKKISLISLILLLPNLLFAENFVIELNSFGQYPFSTGTTPKDPNYYRVFSGELHSTKIVTEKKTTQLIMGHLNFPLEFTFNDKENLVHSSFLYPVPQSEGKISFDEYLDLLELGKFFKFYQGNIDSVGAKDYVKARSSRRLTRLEAILNSKPELVTKFKQFYLNRSCNILFKQF